MTEWETFCDESYYHMWCLRKIGQRGFNDGFHINNRKEAIALCDLINKMERELAEARQQEKIHFDNCASMREQRDRLAEALEWLAGAAMLHRLDAEDEEIQSVNALLEAVKGGEQ